jgi:hypothetical protein
MTTPSTHGTCSLPKVVVVDFVRRIDVHVVLLRAVVEVRRAGHHRGLRFDAHREAVTLQYALHDLRALLGLVTVPPAPNDQGLFHTACARSVPNG